MKKTTFLHLLLLCPILSFTQVGIGTTSPSSNSILELNSDSKGLLLPRLTSTQRSAMNLGGDDEGMIVYHTSPTKGTVTFDGTAWCGIAGATTTGSTICWNDGTKTWMGVTNLFNAGSSIGMGTMVPKTQLHIHADADAPASRIQITNPTTGEGEMDGLLAGISASNGDAHLLQQENKALWFGTNNTERLRIDSAGNINIKGNITVGEFGTSVSGIMRSTVTIDLPNIIGQNSVVMDVAFPNAVENATVYVSPGGVLGSIVIGYARVSSPGNVQIKFTNPYGTPVNEGSMPYHITVIQ